MFTMNLSYIDPSTMTYIIQLVGGAVIIGGVAVGIMWHKIKRFFTKKKDNKDTNTIDRSNTESDEDMFD